MGLAFASYAIAGVYRVVAKPRDVAQPGGLARRPPDRGPAIILDGTRHDQAACAIRAALGRFGRIVVPISDAGYGLVGTVEGTPMLEARAGLQTVILDSLRWAP